MINEDLAYRGGKDIISITVEFSGGLELLFANRRKHEIRIPSTTTDHKPATIKTLVSYLCQHVMQEERRDMFMVDNSVRPGILVLINDADWELEGGLDCELRPQDNILFVSTLHGG